MIKKTLITYGALLTFGLTSLASVEPVQAVDFSNMMNPSKWFGNNNRRYYDDYYGGPWGGYGYPGYGGYGYGPGWGGYGPGWGGYGPYGYGGWPGYGYGYGAPQNTQQAAPPPLPQ